MTRRHTLVATLLCIASTSSVAGPNAALLCDGPSPYDFLSSDTRDFSSFGVRSTRMPVPEAARGKLIDGQSVKAISADGLMLVPSEVGNRGQVELRKRGRSLKTFKGWLQTWDLWSNGRSEKFFFTTWDGDIAAPPTLKTSKTRYIVDGFGEIILEQDFEGYRDGENGEPSLRFSADGDAMHELANSIDPVASRHIFDATELRSIGEVVAPRGQLISDLVMASGKLGFAIVDGRLHRYADGRLALMDLGAPLEVHSLQMDPRSGRILARGQDDFVLLDLTGAKLFRYTSAVIPKLAASAWVQPKLAIDGSVGVLREGDDFALVFTRKSAYSDARHIPLVAEDWNRVACFTPNSAGLLVDERPVLVKF